MSEEEIIEILTDIINDEASIIDEIDYKAIQGLLDLYKHKKGRVEELKQELLEEKEKNKKLEDKIKVKLEKLKGQKGQYRLMLEQEYKGLLEE